MKLTATSIPFNTSQKRKGKKNCVVLKILEDSLLPLWKHKGCNRCQSSFHCCSRHYNCEMHKSKQFL